MAKKVTTTHRRRGGVIVKEVQPDSLAFECGIEPGDKIWSINDHVIPDSLSFTFNMATPDMVMVVEKSDGEQWELEIESEPGVPFGVALEDDPIMLCRNKCIFCFVDQNPKGYRKSLLIKDEDIRLSFMYGNYSTLSSTDEAEEDRIIREKISPLYVSVHATDPATRVFMLKNKKCGNIVERLKKFADGGIEFHAQIVLCPGLNDGKILEKTLQDLSALHPWCLSIAVVPLGITTHRAGLTQLTPVTDRYCQETIDFCRPWQARFEIELGDPLVYLGDEFYIRAEEPLPKREDYRDFPQMENGIGMVRRFMDEFEECLQEYTVPKGTRGTLVTGALFGPSLKTLVDKLNARQQTDIQVMAIRNDSFGADLINVAGLVHGQDIIDQCKDRDLGEFLVVPHVMLKDPEDEPILIDDLGPTRLRNALSVPIVGSGNTAGELFEVLENWKDHLLRGKNPGQKSDLAVAV